MKSGSRTHLDTCLIAGSHDLMRGTTKFTFFALLTGFLGACVVQTGPGVGGSKRPGRHTGNGGPANPTNTAHTTTPEARAPHGAPEKPEEVAKPAARKSASKVVSPAKKREPLRLSAADVKADAERQKKYEEDEAKASAAVKKKITTLRANLAKKKVSFKIGVTAVSGKPIASITGGKPEKPDAKLQADLINQRAQLKTRNNLILASMQARATPPAKLPRPQDPRANAGDHAVAGTATDPVVGAPQNGSYPSSAFPSVSSSAFSWRDRMTPVKNQQSCGSCWAFASTAVFEGSYSLINNQQVDLSEQFLVNCVPPYSGPSGDNCQGNTQTAVWKYLMQNGDNTEQNLGYTAKMSSCTSSMAGTYKIQSWGYVSPNNPSSPSVDELKAAIVAHGPITVSVNATDAFSNYTGGIFDADEGNDTNHAVVLAGWDDSKGAWHMRNSWSADWGEGGYMWIKYGSNGIGTWASWAEAPPVAKAPSGKSFSDRYVSVLNDSGEAVKLNIVVRPSDTNKWYPADPGSANAIQVTLEPGKRYDVIRPDNKSFAIGNAARFWADSLDGKRHWTAQKDKDAVSGTFPYNANRRQRMTFALGKADAPAPADASDKMLQEGSALRSAGKYSEAHDKYVLFKEQYPSDARVPEAAFWIGWTLYKQKLANEAAWAFYDMINEAPQNHPYIGYAFYFQGLSYALEGYCGYAVRALEVPAYGEVPVPSAWVKAAKDEIDKLNNDDGTICDNWE